MFNHEERESKILKPFHKRLSYLLIFVFVIFISMIFRLSFVQIVNGEQYYEKAVASSDKYIPIPAMRGKIYPREGGTPIVDSRASYVAVFTDTEQMKKEDYVNLATKLEPVLTMKKEDILKKMDVGYIFEVDSQGNDILENGKPKIKAISRQTGKFLQKDIKMDLNEQEKAILSEQRSQFKGIEVIPKPIRVYDSRQIAVQAIGYVRPYNIATTSSTILNEFYKGKDNIYTPNQPVGFDGVEFSYEDQLKGVNGKQYFQVSSDGSIQNQLNKVDPKAGNDLYLTIDSRIQLETRDFITRNLDSIRAQKGAEGTRSVYAVAMEVKTGNIVAMISYPEYNPNLWVSGMDATSYNKVKYYVPNGTITSSQYDVSPKTGSTEEDAQLKHEVTKHPTSIVPTGSTIKPATLLMGLTEGVITPNDTWQDPVGGYRYASSASDIVNNDNHHNYGLLTPQRALQRSSNTYMARVGKLLYEKYTQFAKNYKENPVISVMQKYFHALGLGVKTGVPLPSESQGVQDFIATNAQYGGLAAMVQSSFGQQERYTAMQLCQYAATLANKGKRIQPQIVDKIVDPVSKKVIQQSQPKVMNQLNVPDYAWQTVEEGMYMVTQGEGTASWVFTGLPYKFAAKTGTSDQDIYISERDANGKVISTQKKSVANGVFVAYGPIGDPKLAVAIVVPEGGYGGLSCGTIARQLFDSYDKYYGLGPSTK